MVLPDMRDARDFVCTDPRASLVLEELVKVQPVKGGKSDLGLVEKLAVKKRTDAEKAGEE